MNHIIWIVLDSCRFDAFIAADTKNFARIGQPERRYSYASWTSPAHQAYFMGMMPHSSPKRVFASNIYKQEYARWNRRMGKNDIAFSDFLPELNIARFLNHSGYKTIAKVSLPVLNQYTSHAAHFDEYQLMESHNDFAGMLKQISFAGEQPYFYFLNLGETHYPYMLDDQTLPHISGVHGILKKMNGEENASEEFFNEQELARLKQQQIRAVAYCDAIFGKLLDQSPPDTWFIITADHGELFGEEGYFGHGPIMHPKVFEVPFMEGFADQST